MRVNTSSPSGTHADTVEFIVATIGGKLPAEYMDFETPPNQGKDRST